MVENAVADGLFGLYFAWVGLVVLGMYRVVRPCSWCGRRRLVETERRTCSRTCRRALEIEESIR